jgi:2-polyprenyl-3-methyl-5-hydroxy-6-metoxy-1,4-benzoquinol methylase
MSFPLFSHGHQIQAPLSDILLIETQDLQHPQGAILLSATKLVRHGKPSDAILQQKASFFSENQALKDRVERICQFYAAQPLRQLCKNCARPLQGLSFTKLAVRYIICSQCGHLNGAHEDTDAFCEFVYTDNSGEAYAQAYSAADKQAYFSRVEAIYTPKAEFLCEVLRHAGEKPQSLSFADLGAGSGYFVAGLASAGIANVTGYEVSESQLRLARTMLPQAIFHQHALDGIVELAEKLESSVVSMIGVLEHLRHPRELLAALQQNRHVNYIYLSLPMFSPTVFLEAVFPNVFHRQLGAGHTHLYTESSLAWMCREFGLESIGEWWFGTDMVDLLRDIQVSLEANQQTVELAGRWRETFVPLVDAMQLQIDQQKQSSEVHIVLKKST